MTLRLPSVRPSQRLSRRWRRTALTASPAAVWGVLWAVYGDPTAALVVASLLTVAAVALWWLLVGLDDREQTRQVLAEQRREITRQAAFRRQLNETTDGLGRLDERVQAIEKQNERKAS